MFAVRSLKAVADTAGLPMQARSEPQAQASGQAPRWRSAFGSTGERP
jgi:hypothetical protein